MSRPDHGRRASLHSILSAHHPKRNLTALVVPLLILFGTVISAAAQTEAAHYLMADIGYNQPYFAFYLTHSTFSLFFPAHLLVLALTRRETPVATYIDGIRRVIAEQLNEPEDTPWSAILPRWAFKVSWLTLLVSVPALSWFVAMVYSPSMDITAIYATSSFHAYFFSMLLLRQPLSRTTVGSIVLAFAGVIVLSLAGLGDGQGGGGTEEDDKGGGNRLLGDTVMMLGAVVLGFYEVVYKMALPEGHGGIASAPASTPNGYSALPTHSSLPNDNDNESTPPISRSDTPNLNASNQHKSSSHRDHISPERIPLSPAALNGTLSHLSHLRPTSPPSPPLSADASARPRPMEKADLPPALHANFLTSSIGLATAVLFFLSMFALHWTGVEPFRWPGSQGESAWQVWAGLQIVAWGGAIYNAGLMVLIGVWGPTTSSVANLLTIGLVAVIDSVLTGYLPDLQTMIGVGMICVGFGVLLWEGEG